MGRDRPNVSGFLDLIRRIKTDLSEDNLSLVAAGVAFYGMLAVFPAIIAMVTVYALIATPEQIEHQIRPLLKALPPGAADLLVAPLTSASRNSGGLTIGLIASLLGTLWAASGGVSALMTGLNIIYGVHEGRNFIRLKARALSLTLVGMLAAIVALALVAAFPVVLRHLGLKPAAALGAEVARWVMLAVLIALGNSVLYRFGPDRHDVRWRPVSAGAIVALVVWILASIGFSFYVSNFGNYNKAYGSLAAVIVLLLWLYLSAFAVLLGAEIDAIRAERHVQPDSEPASLAQEAPGTGSSRPDANGTEGAGMSTVVESVDVAVPVRTAYNQWTQFEQFPQFMEGVTEIRQIDPTHLHWVVDMAGAHREFDAEITEQHPDERVAWTSLDGPRHAGVVTFHRLDDSHTRVTAQMEIDPAGMVETVGDKTGMVDRRVKGDMKRFRDFIEARGQETGAWRGDVSRP